MISDHFGKDSIVGTAANGEELGDIIIRDKIKQVVFFCGDQRRDELPEKLKQHNVLMEEAVVYNTIETPVLINKKYDAILFFSPSAVQSFFSINNVDKETQLFAIGSTTAKTIQQYNKNNVVISCSPSKENLIKQMIAHFNTTIKIRP